MGRIPESGLFFGMNNDTRLDENARKALEMVEPSRFFVLPYNPTAENMAKYLLEEMCPLVLEGSGARAASVRLWETDDSYAEATLG